jgi:dTDP-4-dehydrorhamnose reductase
MNADSIGPIFVTGASGMLGLALTSLCDELGLACSPYPEAHLDITDAGAVEVAIAQFADQSGGGGGLARRLVVNAAAYTDVERAETDEERAFAVNEGGARNVAKAAAKYGLGLVHVSTDYVYDGTKSEPYVEEDEPNPLSAYGRSKLAGDISVAEVCPRALIVRTAWVYGPGGTNFPRKIVELAGERDGLRVVADEFGSPTASADLARGIMGLFLLGATGLFHLTSSGSCSRYEMAQEIVAAADLPVRLVPVPRSEMAGRAIRPANSVLSLEKAHTLGVELPPWQESLRTYVRHYLARGTA